MRQRCLKRHAACNALKGKAILPFSYLSSSNECERRSAELVMIP